MKTQQPPLGRITSMVFVMLTFLILCNCEGSSPNKPNSITFTIIAKLESINQIDIGEEGHSRGDIRIFEGSLMDEKHKKVGRYTGMHETVSLPPESGNPEQVHEDRFTTHIYEFDDGSTIIRSGLSHYTVGQIEMDMNAPRVRAIIGGTGKYMGTAGQVTTTRIADNYYELKFEILL